MEWLNFRSFIKKLSISLFCLYASLSFIEAANKIMPLGDSLTKGFITGADPADEWGYRGPLWTKLRDGGYTVNFVGDYSSGENYLSIDPTFEPFHSGVNNYTTTDVLTNINTYLTNNDPNVVLFHIGTNDVENGTDISIAVTDVNDTLQNIYDYNSSIKVLLARIINLKSSADPTLRANVTAYNDALETMANTRIANGDNLQIVNMESGAGIDYTTDMESAFHPNQNGYGLMANHWYAALNGEVHHWALDETSGTTFLDAMGSADGACAGNCPVPSAGIKEGAQLFDGTNEVDVTETVTFDVPADANFTIELWAKTTDSGAIKVMIGRDDGTTTDLHWWIGMDSTGEALFTILDRNNAGAPYGTIKGTTPINDGEWHHIAAVRDGNTGDTILYVDGVNEDSHNFTSTGGFAASTPVTIGYFINNSTLGFYFDGALDEIAVYGTALSSAEITQHYQNGLAGNELEVLEDTIAPVITILGDISVEVEVGTSYSDAGATAADDLDGDVTGDIVTVNQVNTSVLGTYSVGYSVSDRAGNTAEANRTVNVIDTQAPVITLNGDANITIGVGSPYIDEGATATDNVDGNLTESIVTVNPVNTNMVGVYTVTYDVNDSSGNAALQVIRTVNVVDTEAPVITLNGDANITIEVGSIYIDAGATATDNVDGNLTGIIVTVNPVNTNIIGVYIVTYDVNDSSGYSAVQVTRTVNVVDTQAPVIILNGDENITITVGTAYNELGATATDNYDGNLTTSIEINASAVDTNTTGVYTVTYDVNDSSGNAALQVTRTVNVVWYAVSSDGNTYTVENSSVSLDSTLFDITFLNDKIVFEEIGSEPKLYIELMSDGTVVTGYRQGTGDDSTVTGEFAPGTKVSVDADMMLLIETPLITNLTLGGTL